MPGLDFRSWRDRLGLRRSLVTADTLLFSGLLRCDSLGDPGLASEDILVKWAAKARLSLGIPVYGSPPPDECPPISTYAHHS